MRLPTLMFALVLAPAVYAQDASKDPEIVVTGTSLEQTREQLEACIARGCDPKQDIDASLAHAESQYIAGDFDGARATLRNSVHRNKRHRQDLPVDVSDLQRAYGRLIEMNGQPAVSRIVQIDALDSLKAGLDKQDRRVFLQRTLVAESFSQAGRLRAAYDVYEDVERQAARAGLPQVSAYALLRRAALLNALASVSPEYRQRYRAALTKLESLEGPDMGKFRVAAVILRAQDTGHERDESALDAAIAKIDPQQFDRPFLLYAPPVILNKHGKSRMGGSGAKIEPDWMDVRIAVTRQGKVEGYEILRRTDGIDARWVKQVTDTIPRRRYAPFVPASGETVSYRVERFSFVRDWSTMPTASSRVRTQNTDARLVWLDLTPDNVAARPSANPGT